MEQDRGMRIEGLLEQDKEAREFEKLYEKGQAIVAHDEGAVCCDRAGLAGSTTAVVGVLSDNEQDKIEKMALAARRGGVGGPAPASPRQGPSSTQTRGLGPQGTPWCAPAPGGERSWPLPPGMPAGPRAGRGPPCSPPRRPSAPGHEVTDVEVEAELRAQALIEDEDKQRQQQQLQHEAGELVQSEEADARRWSDSSPC